MKYKILFLIIPIVVLLAGAGLGVAYFKHEQNEKKDAVPASDIVVPEDSASKNTNEDKTADKSSNANVAATNTATKTSTTTSTNTNTKPSNTNTSTPAPTNTAPTKQPGTYTVAEVQAANTASKCWTVIRGKVYNLTSYLNAHPGGKANIMQVCGKDGTATFDAQHSGQGKPEDKLASLYLGTLVK